jgi:hypothetical protein
MSLTLVISQDAPLPSDKLSNPFLKRHGLLNNKVMNPNVTANVIIVPKSLCFSGGETFVCVWVEWIIPSLAFASREMPKGYGQDVVDIILDLSDGKLPKESNYFNVVHTVVGTWNLDGAAMSNKGLLGTAIGAGRRSRHERRDQEHSCLHGAWDSAWEFEEIKFFRVICKLGIRL